MPSFLPDANFATKVTGSGTLTASQINELANEPRDLTTTVAARGAPLPMLYGQRDVPGLLFATGLYPSTTNRVFGFIWCLGECQSIEAVYINDALVTNAGGGDAFAITNYLGTPSQGVDPTLAASVAAYADTMRVPVPGGGYLGICYSVIRIPTGKISGFPRVRAVIKGRKVYDPRTLTTAYSDNPALCVADLISNPVFGLGRTVTGVEECADWDDSLLGGVEGAYRARIALYIASGRPADEYVDLMCEYAECFRINEGESVKLIPDAPVDLDVMPIVGPAQIIKDTLQLEAESSADTPTAMEIQYTVTPSDPTQPWGMEPVSVSLSGVDEGEVQRIPTSVSMEGITRSIEASNKALARLMRMQKRITATWTTQDKGVVYQRGDVVRIQHAPRGITDLPVRIMDVNLIGPGRHQVTAKRYDASHYPADFVPPDDDGVVPVGAIGMLIGTTVPDGWELFSEANDKYIVGAGGTYAVGASGTSTAGPWAGFVTGGSHTAATDMAVAKAGGGPVSGRITKNDSQLGSHSHTWSLASVNEDLLRRENVLVIKTGSAGLRIPSTVRVFGLDNTLTEATKNLSFVNRLLMAKSASANAGVSVASASSAMMGSGNDYHIHLQATNTPLETFGGVGTPARANSEAGGSHTHTLSLTPTFNVKRKQLCCFESVTDYAVRPGMIVMWKDSLDTIPDDYVLCDGSTNGTPNMTDGRYVEFGADTSAVPAGDNTMTLAGTSSTVGHSHDGGALTYPGNANGQGHAYTDSHSHAVSTSVTYAPKYHALAFIMYAPAG